MKVLNLGAIVSHSYKQTNWLIYQFDIVPFTLKESEYLNTVFINKFMNVMLDWLLEKAWELTNGFDELLNKERWHWGIQIFDWYYTKGKPYIPDHTPAIMFRIIQSDRNRVYVNDLGLVSFNYIFGEFH